MTRTLALALALALAALAAVVAVAPASGARQVVWSGNAETGDLSQWSGDGGGGAYNTGTGTVRVQRSVVRSGRYAVRLAISRAGGEHGSQAARLFRWRTAAGDPLPLQARYSAWFYFPRRVRPAEYWNVLQWKTKIADSRVEPTFVLGVAARPSGAMHLNLWDAIRGRDRGSSPIDLPTGRWVHIAADYRWSTGRGGRVTVHQDGRVVVGARGVQTALPSRDPQRRSWSLDNYTNGIAPPRATIYVDDALISVRRR